MMNWSAEVKKGFFLGVGVMAAVIAVGFASGVVGKRAR
jgi:hypothetical protein